MADGISALRIRENTARRGNTERANRNGNVEGSWPAQDVTFPQRGWLAWRAKDRRLLFAGELPRNATKGHRGYFVPWELAGEGQFPAVLSPCRSAAPRKGDILSRPAPLRRSWVRRTFFNGSMGARRQRTISGGSIAVPISRAEERATS